MSPVIGIGILDKIFFKPKSIDCFNHIYRYFMPFLNSLQGALVHNQTSVSSLLMGPESIL